MSNLGGARIRRYPEIRGNCALKERRPTNSLLLSLDIPGSMDARRTSSGIRVPAGVLMLMFILVGWLVFSCVLMSFIEHQVHKKLMHRRSTASFKRTFEAHALVHHRHYSEIFSDEPVARGEDDAASPHHRRAPSIASDPICLARAIQHKGTDSA